jgi:hypothetical protein
MLYVTLGVLAGSAVQALATAGCAHRLLPAVSAAGEAQCRLHHVAR